MKLRKGKKMEKNEFYNNFEKNVRTCFPDYESLFQLYMSQMGFSLGVACFVIEKCKVVKKDDITNYCLTLLLSNHVSTLNANGRAKFAQKDMAHMGEDYKAKLISVLKTLNEIYAEELNDKRTEV